MKHIGFVMYARKELFYLIAQGEMPFDFCADVFGLEPDYLDELLL